MLEGVTIPDAVEPVTGWRAWYVCRDATGEVRLRSIIRGQFVWPTRAELEATCVAIGSGHDHAPVENCSCGIYASLTPKQVKPFLVGYNNERINPTDIWRAFGRVNLWGRVIEGTNGWRAQYAYPHSLALPATAVGFGHPVAGMTLRSLSRNDREEVAAELRAAYGIPVVAELRQRPIVRRLLRR